MLRNFVVVLALAVAGWSASAGIFKKKDKNQKKDEPPGITNVQEGSGLKGKYLKPVEKKQVGNTGNELHVTASGKKGEEKSVVEIFKESVLKSVQEKASDLQIVLTVDELGDVNKKINRFAPTIEQERAGSQTPAYIFAQDLIDRILYDRKKKTARPLR